MKKSIKAKGSVVWPRVKTTSDAVLFFFNEKNTHIPIEKKKENEGGKDLINYSMLKSSSFKSLQWTLSVRIEQLNKKKEKKKKKEGK